MTITTTRHTDKETSTPALRDPFAAMREMRRAMFRSFFEPMPTINLNGELMPAVNVKEKDGTYHVDCALPGYKKDDVHVELGNDSVTISGTYKEDKKDEQAHYHRRELLQSSFARTIELPEEIDVEKASATFDNGMLKLTLPPAKTSTKKTIPISG